MNRSRHVDYYSLQVSHCIPFLESRVKGCELNYCQRENVKYIRKILAYAQYTQYIIFRMKPQFFDTLSQNVDLEMNLWHQNEEVAKKLMEVEPKVLKKWRWRTMVEKQTWRIVIEGYKHHARYRILVGVGHGGKEILQDRGGASNSACPPPCQKLSKIWYQVMWARWVIRRCKREQTRRGAAVWEKSQRENGRRDNIGSPLRRPRTRSY